MPHPQRRLIGFLAVSAALHLLWLAIPLPVRHSPPIRMPLVAKLAAPAAPEKSAVVVWNAPHGVRHPPRRNGTAANSLPAAAPEPVPAAPTIDLDAALAAVRHHVREAPPHPAPATYAPTLTVEAAVARATKREELVETRGAAGEYVTTYGKTRCVTPLVVPHFLEGKTMLTQCETRRS